MSYTGTEIFNRSIVILDELSENGSVDVNKTKEYYNRAPMLLDMWQHEMAESGNLLNITEYVSDDETLLNKWTLYSIPSGMKRIKEMIFIDADSQISTVQYKQFGNADIYIYFIALGTARMLYIPIPVKITALTQTLEVDEITAISGAYYLAEHFALADQNDELAARCRQKYAELKAESSQKTALSPQQIIDVYSIRGGE